MNEHELRAEILRRINAGDMPRAAGNWTLASYAGGDTICDGCGRGIARREVQYEVTHPPRGPLVMHLTCYDLWKRELDRIPGR